MAFDDSTRNRLQRFVKDARAALTGEFTRQLQNDYGLDPRSGAVTPLDDLGHLDHARRETARLLRETLDHYRKTSPTSSVQETLDRITREQAFTVLNRLAALRLAEARGLLTESIAKGYDSKGFQLYAKLAGTGLGEKGDAYRAYLMSVFDEFALDLRVLFDRFSPMGRLFPREAALLEVLALINDPEIAPLWAEDETIGWIYQYFNSKEERKKMRDESAAPRNSRELAVRNQFFTPRYVVEFLTDNTLGRIWYEMTKGRTRLAEQCRYLVRRPFEIFLGELGYTECRAAWVKHILESADFSQMPENPTLEEVSEFALIADGYNLIERLGYTTQEFIDKFYDPQAERAHAGEHRWEGSLLELWCCLFIFQRHVLREYCPARMPVSDDKITSGLYPALRHALQNPPTELSQEELLRQPVFIPHRPIKDPREIRMLDPACGSMHFGLYAFDLFEVIYEEGWERGLMRPEALPVVKAPFPHATVRFNNEAESAHSNYSGKMIPVDAAYVVTTATNDDGDDVYSNTPYIIDENVKFRIPFERHIPLREFDYQQGLREGWFGEAEGEAFVRESGCFLFDQVVEVPEEDAQEKFRREIPRFIVERNLHGIDIDPRAVQIAGLSLWLRAHRAWQQMNVKPGARPQIRRSNIVCAEPMPGEQDLLEEFITEHLSGTPELRLVAQLVRHVFEAMKLAGEAGSLLKIEEEIAGAVAEAKKQWLADPKQGILFGDLVKPEQQRLGFEVVEITDSTFWERAEDHIYEALRSYAEEVEESGYQRRLFAEDAVRGFSFIDLCRKYYDVALMNPPFGEHTATSKVYLFSIYQASKFDLAAAFADRASDLLIPNGLIGSLTNRSIFFGQMLGDWRHYRFCTKGTLHTFVDLGTGVLDAALVEAVAYTFSRRSTNTPTQFIKALDHELALVAHIRSIHEGLLPSETFLLSVERFRPISDFPLAYWTPTEWLNAYSKFAPLEDQGFVVKQGMESSDNFRFVRLWWEIQVNHINWKPYSKGGWFGPQWRDLDVVVNWGTNGNEVKEFSASIYGTWTKQITNSEYYTIPGLCYPASRVEFSPRILPSGSIVGCKGPIVALQNPHDQVQIESTYIRLLALMSSSAFRALVNLTTTSGDTMRKSYRERAVAQVPAPPLQDIGIDIESLTYSVIEYIRNHESTIETCRSFLYVLDDNPRKEFVNKIRSSRTTLDNMVCQIYGFAGPPYLAYESTGYDDFQENADLAQDEIISATLGYVFGRWNICLAINRQSASVWPNPFAPLPICPPGMLQNDRGLPAEPADVPSNYPLRISWPGILVDDPGHAEDIEHRVHEAVQAIWKDRADTIEQEACDILGVKSLRDYFRKPSLFFADHLKRYSKSRRQAPIYWPLSTPSGSYTLWLYYHRLNDQTLYSCVNDFITPKLEDVNKSLSDLRVKDKRTRDEADEMEQLEEFAVELQEFRDELLRLARLPWRPNLNDGVQITAAPLWKLFRLSKWQKTLKETWQKLEKGEYDWAHLAYTVWPDRVREKCKKDKSLAIAHDLEELYQEPPAAPKKARKRKKE